MKQKKTKQEQKRLTVDERREKCTTEILAVLDKYHMAAGVDPKSCKIYLYPTMQ